MNLQVQDLSYIHPNGDILFQNINFSISSGEKCAIVGNNGVGKIHTIKNNGRNDFPAMGKSIV